jgi:hypothetical protein
VTDAAARTPKNGDWHRAIDALAHRQAAGTLVGLLQLPLRPSAAIDQRAARVRLVQLTYLRPHLVRSSSQKGRDFFGRHGATKRVFQEKDICLRPRFKVHVFRPGTRLRGRDCSTGRCLRIALGGQNDPAQMFQQIVQQLTQGG